MPCYHPIPGWYAKRVEPSGKRRVVFSLEEGFKDKPAVVPCGTCVGCREERARQWAVRCMHEAKLWPVNSFVTLTYSPENVPANGSLRPDDFVKFMKRLRVSYGEKVRFFQCGEYGAELGRPHHHALLFNCDFADKRVHRQGGSAVSRLYRSSFLERLWPYGFCSIGAVTYESAGYVARYSLKKVLGSDAGAWYGNKIPEYATMSRRPGIGRGHMEKFAKDVYPRDEVIVKGKPRKPPRYYDGVLESVSGSVFRRIKARRRRAAQEDVNSSGSRLVVREEVKRSGIGLMRSNRPLEES